VAGHRRQRRQHLGAGEHPPETGVADEEVFSAHDDAGQHHRQRSLAYIEGGDENGPLSADGAEHVGCPRLTAAVSPDVHLGLPPSQKVADGNGAQQVTDNDYGYKLEDDNGHDSPRVLKTKRKGVPAKPKD
jgi:hypothetical protein